MFEIRKQFTFSAAHQLDHLPKDHPCSRIHGHNNIVGSSFRRRRSTAMALCDRLRRPRAAPAAH